jgi:DNA-binding PadR family transcriptional regulator
MCISNEAKGSTVAGDSVQMFILGSLTQGDAHGYQLVARAKKWGVSAWAGFGSGSMYNALRTLEKRDFIVQRGTEQRGRYAPATVYGITEEGQGRLREMLHESARQVVGYDPFDLATAFFGVLPVEERRELIKAHIDGIQKHLEWWQPRYEEAKATVAGGGPFDWVLAAIEKGRRVAGVATEASEDLLVRCEKWGPPEPLARREES